MSDPAVHEPTLTYERPASHYATRRQFRLLLTLVLLNLLITLQFAYFPNVTAAVKNRWAQYQQKREREAEVRQALALEQQAMAFTEPPGKVVWDENPDTAAALLAGGGYKRVTVDGVQYMPPLANWPRGAAAAAPAIAQTYLFKFPYFASMADDLATGNEERAVLFLHGLKSPSGQQRLVCLQVTGKLDLHNSDARGHLEAAGSDIESVRARGRATGRFTVMKDLRVMAMPALPGGGEQPPSALPAEKTVLLIHGRGSEGMRLNWQWTPPRDGKPEQIRIEGREMFRFYAGQPDPSDPSRFTIDYDVDGQRGSIRGQLRNDGRIDLVPTTGRTVGNRWHPLNPTTRPGGT